MLRILRLPLKIIGFSMLLLVGCAGPISPFGGVEVWSGDGQNFTAQNTQFPADEVSIYPRRQVLHKPSDFKIELNSAYRVKPQIKVTYNNKDVTNTFLKSAKIEEAGDNQIQLVFNRLNLKPDRRHDIDIYWRANKLGRFFHLSYLPPYCFMNEPRKIASTEPFTAKPEYIETIYRSAISQQLNPAMLAGLIAQESGFDPNQVSRAKAVGLTQVTNIADDEIKKLRPEWKRDPRVEKLNVNELKYKILTREISFRQDWRLNPEQAIEGGALYINYLSDYWNIPENKSLLNSFPKIDSTEVILASYNSGAARVKNKIKSSGEKWLDDDELKEAFKYVNSVVSYCYHFSEVEQ